VPSEPLSVTASAGDGQATISFNVPLDDGNSTILYYMAVSDPGANSATSTESPIIIDALNNGTEYIFTVYAVNGVGTSSSSEVSNAVIPIESFIENNESEERNSNITRSRRRNILPKTNQKIHQNIIAENLDKKFKRGFDFNNDLYKGLVDEKVRDLQKFLNINGYLIVESGPGSIGNETNFFGSLTQGALISFQKENGISPAVGYFGPITRSYIYQNSK
jgi:hypothetical protein